ncbi:MAG: rhodanese-like domain-containing protein [Actinobacteria bacterium]|nr:rhodanese-like domain-containing protein [Actinomycetota bacterium]
MSGHRRVRRLLLGAAALLIFAGFLAIASGCGSSSSTTPPATTAVQQTAFDKIASFMNGFMNSQTDQKTISATDLNKLMTTSKPGDAPLVLDVRSAKDYSTASSSSPGHIPGAINIPYKTMAEPTSIATLKSALAKQTNKTIVDHCYTAHTQSIATPVIVYLAQTGQLGTPAPKIQGLDFGMLGYNTVETPPTYKNTFPLEKTSNVPTGTFPLPSITGDLVSRAQQVLPNMPGRLNVSSDQTINKKPESSYTIIDIRSATEYNQGHLPGAINLPYQDLFKKVGDTYPSLAKIDRSKQILVVGNSHNVEEFVAVGLNLLGISQQDSNTGALGFGIATWNNTVGVKFTSADKNSLPTVTGTAPGKSPGSPTS